MGARENILGRLKKASDRRNAKEPKQPDLTTEIYLKQDKKLADNFQKNLELIAGKVVRCKNLDKAVEQLKSLLTELQIDKPYCLDKDLQSALNGKIEYTSAADDFETMQAGITPCEFLVAHLGSVMVSSGGTSGRRLHVFPETHFVIAHKDQLVNFLDDGIAAIQKKYNGKLPSSITNITGPSRTADIEKTLVLGMHGPRKLFVLLCDEPF